MEATESSPSPGSPATLAGELHTLFGRMKRRLREQASVGDFTPSQIAVLRRLESDGPLTVTKLAQAEGVRPQSMGATVAVLQAAGLLGGEPHPTDGRQTLLFLTDRCRETIAASRAARTDWLVHAIETKLGPEEQERLTDAVGLLLRLVDDPQ